MKVFSWKLQKKSNFKLLNISGLPVESDDVDELAAGVEVLGIEAEIFAKNTIEALAKSFIQILGILHD